jgi:membrane fusion protein, heavy metal efflux system
MEKLSMKRYGWMILLLPLWLSPFVYADDDDEEEEGPVELVFSAAERAELGIVTAAVGLQTLAPEVKAPGEVRLNAYRTTQIAPRIDAQVVARHARMGESVDTNAALVTLTSVDMADAVGDLLVSDREWQRVKSLGRDVVSEARYVQAEVARQQAHAKVLAYGMPKSQLDRLLKTADLTQATGAFTLYAPHAGMVIEDAFVVGEVVEAGRLLMEVSDLSTLWVEARVDPELAASIDVGDAVRVSANDHTWTSGKVSQRYQRLNEATRTLGIRIDVPNDGTMVPGQFVNIAVQTGTGVPRLAVPRAAVLLVLGTPMVFKLEADTFEPQPVEVGLNAGEWTIVTAGLEAGDVIATEGVFELKSLLLKSQIGDAD